jgi:hypothetical protein
VSLPRTRSIRKQPRRSRLRHVTSSLWQTCTRKATQSHVSVGSAMQASILSKTPLIAHEFVVNLSGLVELRPAVLYIQKFLECHYIGVKFRDHSCDPLRTSTPLKRFTLVDVVGTRMLVVIADVLRPSQPIRARARWRNASPTLPRRPALNGTRHLRNLG